jgi:hypothetical protein
VNAPFAFDRERSFYRQSNNPTDEILRKIHLQMSLDIRKILTGKTDSATLEEVCRKILSYLETCGPTAGVMCMAALGRFLSDPAEGAQSQREEEFSDAFNDSRNYAAFRAARPDINPAVYPGNRIPQYYPHVARQLYQMRCEFEWCGMEAVKAHLLAGRTAQLCFKNPGHFIAAVAFDERSQEVIFNDPWPEQYADGNGFNRRMGARTMGDLVEPYALIYYPSV